MTDTRLYYDGHGQVTGLQILKLLGALAIVHIHTQSFLSGYWNLVWRFAVPCFFMISGYFLPSPDGSLSCRRIRRALSKMARLTLVTLVAYVSLKWALDWAMDRWWPGRFYHTLAPMASPAFWIRLPLFGDSHEGAFWYLLAYTQLLGLLWLAVRFRFVMVLYGLAVVAIPVMLWAEQHFIMGPEEIRIYIFRPYVVIRNCLTVGLPFVVAGMVVRRTEHIIRRYAREFAGFLLLAACVLTYYEFDWLATHHNFHRLDMYLTTAPAAVCVFILFLTLPQYKALQPVASLGRNYATPIYLIHPMVINLLPMAGALVAWLGWPVMSRDYRAVFTIGVCVICATIWLGVKRLMRRRRLAATALELSVPIGRQFELDELATAGDTADTRLTTTACQTARTEAELVSEGVTDGQMEGQ